MTETTTPRRALLRGGAVIAIAMAVMNVTTYGFTILAARILEGAQRQIIAERQAAEISLKSEIGLLATELAEKIVGEHLKDTELTARVVDRFLDDLDSATVQES